MADRCGYVSINDLIQNLEHCKKSYNLSGDEPITDTILIDRENHPEYPLGTILFRLKEQNGKYGDISISPRKLSEKLN